MQRRPPSDGEVFVTRGPDLEAVSIQVEVMAGAGVPADAAAVPLAQEVTADLSGPGHVGNVLTQTVAEEGLHPGAVILLKQSNTSCVMAHGLHVCQLVLEFALVAKVTESLTVIPATDSKRFWVRTNVMMVYIRFGS